MPNFVERYPIPVIAAAIAGGLLLRQYRKRAAQSTQRATEQAINTDANPWNIQTTSAMDAFSYYTVATSNSRLVYGVGQEVNLVSTNMLDAALKQQHDQIMQEVGTQISALQEGWDAYVYNPYDTAISGAVNGSHAEYTQSIGGHD